MLRCYLSLTILIFAIDPGLRTNAAAQAEAPTPAQLISWLDDPSRQWLATVEMARTPGTAVPRLLEPGVTVLAPHASFSSAMLALAKIGEPAIPALVERLRAIQRLPPTEQPTRSGQALPLILVLGAIGPAAIPALVECAELDEAYWATPSSALGAIVAMEPRTSVYGQMLNPWILWRPGGDPDRLGPAVRSVLPRVEALLEKFSGRGDPDFTSPVKPAAYLLARWGDARQRSRGLEALENAARSAKQFYYSVEIIRQLFQLGAPSTAALIRTTAPRVQLGTDLTGSYFLGMAIALQQLGESDYGVLVDRAVQTGRPHHLLEAADFLGTTEDLRNVPRLVALLDDRTAWNGRVIGDQALAALNRLTLQDEPLPREAWPGWMKQHRTTSYQRLREQWIARLEKRVVTMPIWEANAAIEQLQGTGRPDILRVVTPYLKRRDLDASAIKLGDSRGGSGVGPNRDMAPAVTTLLLGLAQRNVRGAVDVLELCLRAVDPEVRLAGAMALAAYRRSLAVASLDGELRVGEGWQRNMAAEKLLQLGDARGFPIRLDALASGGGIYGGNAVIGDDDPSDFRRRMDRTVRQFACQDLRVFSQQPLPCDPRATGQELQTQVSAWSSWWSSTGGVFVVPRRAASLDLENIYRVPPVTLGSSIVR